MKSASSPSAKPRNVKQASTTTKSKTDYSRLTSATKPGKASAEHPETEMKYIVRGIVRKGLQPAPSKELVSLRVDQDVLEWFKSKGAGYQTRINAVLKAYRDASA
jgi:uncharacterized protein (DUF4415 family)